MVTNNVFFWKENKKKIRYRTHIKLTSYSYKDFWLHLTNRNTLTSPTGDPLLYKLLLIRPWWAGAVWRQLPVTPYIQYWRAYTVGAFALFGQILQSCKNSFIRPSFSLIMHPASCSIQRVTRVGWPLTTTFRSGIVVVKSGQVKIKHKIKHKHINVSTSYC